MKQRQQQQQPPLLSQQQAGGPISKGQQQQGAMPKQPPRQDNPQGQRKGKNDGPPAQERERTRGHVSQHHPRNVAQGETSQSIPSSSSSSSTNLAYGGAIPKASKTGKSIVEETSAAPQDLRALCAPTKKPGTRGKQLGLIETNYLVLDISNLVKNVYKYDVEINIKRGPKRLNMAAFQKFCAQFFSNEHGISYDWRKIGVTARKLNIKGELVGDVQITHPGSGKILDCTVTIKPASDGAMVPVKSALTK